MQYFTERLKHTPSLLGLTSLRVIGDVWFGKDVVLQVMDFLVVGDSAQFWEFSFSISFLGKEVSSSCIGLRRSFPRSLHFQGNIVIWSKKDEKIEIPDGETIKDQVDILIFSFEGSESFSVDWRFFDWFLI